uniref:Uncharacterized protein n=1 Tax=Glossina palpalis gambiensis TaxID=67801 RepID=A0A1B0BK75_9MUSC
MHLQFQTLAEPQTLELTAVNQMTLIENLPLFEKNGFKFSINSDVISPPTKKISLLGKPFSKNWEFSKEDIDELIFMLAALEFTSTEKYKPCQSVYMLIFGNTTQNFVRKLKPIKEMFENQQNREKG